MIVRTEGLVLRTYRMTTSSKVAIVFTRAHGKLRLAAKGARRPRSRFGASLESITHASFVVYRQERRELQTVSEADIVYAFSQLKADYRRMVCGSAVCDLLDQMTADEDPNRELFQAAMDALHWLERIRPESVEVPVWYFELLGADALGYRPHLDACVTCGRPVTGTVRFSPSAGGVVCPVCGPEGTRLDAATAAFLHQLQTRPRHGVVLDAVTPSGARLARQALRAFLEYHLESRRPVKALDFMDRMLSTEVGGGVSAGMGASLVAEACPAPYDPRGGEAADVPATEGGSCTKEPRR